MPSIKPFKGIRYNKKTVGGLSRVVAPPYDIIPPAMQEGLYKNSPYNIVRLILGKKESSDTRDDNRYTRARVFFESWLARDVMLEDTKPSIYAYSQSYKYGTKRVNRLGFIALMGLDQAKGKKVLPHEFTLAAPKTDRLELMREVRANLSPIFVLYDDTAHSIVKALKKFTARSKPIASVDFQKVNNKLWAVDDDKLTGKISRMMANKETFIADGHHRYEVACNYAAEAKENDNARFMMVYFVESDEKMLTVLPTHRIVKDIGALKAGDIAKRLSGAFKVESVKGLKNLTAKLAKIKDSCAFGMYAGAGAFYLIRLKDARLSDAAIIDRPKDWKRLDVAILHMFVLQKLLGIRDEDDNIEFAKEAKDAVSMVDGGNFKLAFFLNPTKVSQVKRIAKLGERMPRKATYFYPKPLSGLVINKF